jgi:excisionase family DNA binding protein
MSTRARQCDASSLAHGPHVHVTLPAAEGNDLLTAGEVASILRVTPDWVYAQTRSGRIPHLRLGRYVRYRRRALIEWMEAMESSSSRQSARPGRWPG